MSRDKHPAAPANGRCDAIVPERLRLRPLLRGAWSAYRACELQCPLDYSLMPLRLRPANQAGDECRSVLQCADDCHEPDKSPAAPADDAPRIAMSRISLRQPPRMAGAMQTFQNGCGCGCRYAARRAYRARELQRALADASTPYVRQPLSEQRLPLAAAKGRGCPWAG